VLLHISRNEEAAEAMEASTASILCVHAPARALNKGNNSEDQEHTATPPLA